MQMHYQQYRKKFERDGFVVVPQFLTEDEFAELTVNLDRYIRTVVPTLSDADAFYQDKSRPETLKQLQRMGIDPFFAAYSNHPRWQAMAEALLGERAEGQDPEWFNKPPAMEHPTPPHQDNYYFKLNPPNVLTAWLALDQVDQQNGCLRYVVGSHKRGLRSHDVTSVLGFSQGITDYGPVDESREVVATLQPRDLVVHHGETIHRADRNTSVSRNRRAFAVVYRGISCQLDEEAQRRYLERARQQQASMELE
ncbi:MAG: phytanoyl-CoA dioxygenase family protein [Pirellulales bacterium]|nr:phytanoyl-CoA dioxygenase family protein [Pirellulales bacterium]